MAATTTLSNLSIENVMSKFSDAFDSAIDTLSVEARILLGILITIDLLWSVLSNLDEQDHLKNLILRSIKYGFFYWIVANYRTLLAQVVNGFILAGIYAGPSSESVIKGYLSHPEQLFIFGLKVIKDNIDHINKLQSTIGSSLAPITSSSVLWHDIIALMIMGGFLVMTMQIFLTILEFYILGGIALIIVPFGAFQRTSHIAEKVFTLVVCFGIKLMVIVFILSVIEPLFSDFKTDAAVKLDVYSALLEFAGCMALTFLMWHAPNMASGLIAGAMSMNAFSSVSQARGMAYGMGMGTAAGVGAGSRGSENINTVREATNVPSSGASGAGGTDTGTVSAAGADRQSHPITYALANMGGVINSAQGHGNQSSNGKSVAGGTPGGGQSAGGVTVAGGGGSNAAMTASGVTNRYQSQTLSDTSQAAATRETKGAGKE